MSKFNPAEFEAKWRKCWSEDRLYSVDLDSAKRPYYLLVEFTYPSGDLHIGHWFAFAVPDILGRFKRMQGFNVFYPNGFDAFGLPAENAAIRRGVHPKDWTLANIERMKEQFFLMGATHNWEQTLNSCDTDYYRWNQWIFLKMLERGLAYKDKYLSNWCPSCQTVLANENVEAGRCWRCGSEVEQKEVEQWFLKITEYADRLVWPDPPAVDWPRSVIEGQNNWIGRSEGVEIKFEIRNSKSEITVFTTRPETLSGATFVVISPEHEFVRESKLEEVKQYIEKSAKKSEQERKESRQKTGVFIGSYVTNPLTQEQIPVWVADYVAAGYGTGAIMGVPAEDSRDLEFAKQYGLTVKKVDGGDGWKQLGQAKTVYHLHDWSISRQRYWGTPIPIINCQHCGVVPVPEQDLPVELPYAVEYAPKGRPPLATAEEWINVSCPKCGGEAKREAETMDTFFDSSWYFLRYLDPKNTEQIFRGDRVKTWMPVDIYFGGAEHTLGHTLYSRFFVKFFQDLGLVDFGEYAKKRVQHGVILGPDGARMSKSRGNVVNPDEQVQKYGADAVRCYLAFLGPYDLVAPWNPDGIWGVYHFLERVWGLFQKTRKDSDGQNVMISDDLTMMHKTIKKVGSDIENMKFNTGLSALMEWLNYLCKKDQVSSDEYRVLLTLLAPFAPHLTEELWEAMGGKYSIHQQPWPEFDPKYLEEAELTLVVQVNGKVRETLLIGKDLVDQEVDVVNLAKNSPKVAKYLDGREITRTVYIPGKILNLVVSG